MNEKWKLVNKYGFHLKKEKKADSQLIRIWRLVFILGINRLEPLKYQLTELFSSR